MKLDKSNFKDTKLGLLPNEWDVVSVESVFDFLKTNSLSRSNLNNEALNSSHIYNIHYGDIHSAFNFNNLDLEKQEQLPRVVDENKLSVTTDFLNEGDIVLADASEDYKGLCDSIEIKNINSLKLVSGLHTFALRDKSENFAKGFKSYAFKHEAVVKSIARIATGISVLGVSKYNLKKILLALPPLKEQQKIAQILSQWDEAIETTQHLIAQLQLRKKGLMQELLSGKKRLAGFSDEWETIRGDKLFASISNKKHDGEFEVLSATQDKGVIPRSETGIDIKYDKKSLGNYKKLDIGDFVISLRSFQGGIEYSNYEGLVSPAYTVLREKLPIAKKFYQEYMKTENFINRLNSIIYGIRDGKQISYKEFGSLKFEYPPLEEQEAISKIIVTADAEIKEKQEYLVVLQNQKKGLMQQLLTGQKRVKID